MPRPPKCRRVEFLPDVTYFKPVGVPMRLLDEVLLSVEEAEALRLKDLEELEQSECAERMNISRPTFQRVLAASRRKIADALLHGKALRIQGGNFEVARHRFRCHNGHEWDTSSETITGRRQRFCPACGTAAVTLAPAIEEQYAKRGRRRILRKHVQSKQP